ncbi:MAG: hypothetical protein K2W92_01445, partial [Alphaproteobacteria bacterium]|nr:hypothetical protein [Alphaproteobacteria bacterium]
PHSSELLQNEGFQNVESHHGTTQAETSQNGTDETRTVETGTAESGASESRLSAHRETSQPRVETRQGEGTAAVVQGEAAQAFHRTTEPATAQAGALQAGPSQREEFQSMGQAGSSQVETLQKKEHQSGIAEIGTIENYLSQTQIGQTGSTEGRGIHNIPSQALIQNAGGNLKINVPSQRDLKERLASIEDKLMEQQEFFEKEALQRKEKVPSK